MEKTMIFVRVIKSTDEGKDLGFYSNQIYEYEPVRLGVTNERNEVVILDDLLLTGVTIKFEFNKLAP